MKAFSVAVAASVAMMMGASSALAETLHFEAELAGAGEAAEIPETATGFAEATLETETMMLEWTVTYSGLSGPVFAAHIHGPAEPGEDAGIQVGFENAETSPITGSAQLTEEQIVDLMDGKYYVNVHTEQQRGGEVRGHLVMVDGM